MQNTSSHPAAHGAFPPPRWTTVLGVGFALLVLFGLLGAVLAILLALVRSRLRRRQAVPSGSETGWEYREERAGRQLGVSAALLLLIDVVALTCSQYLGAISGALLAEDAVAGGATAAPLALAVQERLFDAPLVIAFTMLLM